MPHDDIGTKEDMEVILYMKYITGIHALNLKCQLDTCGDWHTSALKWENISKKESNDSIWGNYGIECNRTIPFLSTTLKYNIANHIRALLDLIEEGNFAVAQGMNKDYICNDSYNKEIFDKIILLRQSKIWKEINKFMEHEYLMQWVNYIRSINNE